MLSIAVSAELSRYERDHVAQKQKNIYYLVLSRESYQSLIHIQTWDVKKIFFLLTILGITRSVTFILPSESSLQVS